MDVMLRGSYALVSPIYSAMMQGRNLKSNRGIGVRQLARPVISIGNITAGGTGKTPVVRWLCERLREAGDRPAVLLRGYKARTGERGDEQSMLEAMLNRAGTLPIRIQANADRFAGGVAVLKDDPSINAFILDDGFQHRRLRRNFDLVLIDATLPLGFGWTFPRGLLREPATGLRRADAILITRSDQVPDVQKVVDLVRRYNSAAPIFQCSHAHVGLRTAEGDAHSLAELSSKRLFAFAGIGNPQGFATQLKGVAGELVGSRWFADHWDYSGADLAQVIKEAGRCRAEVIVTTEKDWVKVARVLSHDAPLAIWRVELAVKFADDHEGKLLEMIRSVLIQSKPKNSPAVSE